MATIHPLAEFYNTPEQLQLMKNYVGEIDLSNDIEALKQQIENIEKIIIKKVWDKIRKDLLKTLESDISKMIVTQLNKELKKNKNSLK